MTVYKITYEADNGCCITMNEAVVITDADPVDMIRREHDFETSISIKSIEEITTEYVLSKITSY